MTLAMSRSLDGERAKERAELAKKAGCLYRPDIEVAHYLDTRFRAGDGIRPVVRWGDEAECCGLGPIYGKSAKEKKHALYHAEIAADTYRRYFLMNDGRRHEVEQRERHAAEQAEKRRVLDLRKALTSDRLVVYDALADLVRLACRGDADCSLECRNARQLLDRHREAAEAIRSEAKSREG